MTKLQKLYSTIQNLKELGLELGEDLLKQTKNLEQDVEGMQTLRNLAKNMAWLVKMRAETQNSIQIPNYIKVARTNFIR